jgi:hypothetical protein
MKNKVSLKLTLLALIVVIVSCDPSPNTNLAANTETPNPIETSAILLSPTPTISAPISSSPEDYQLSPWTADQADETIIKMEKEVLGFWEAELEPWERFPPYAAVWYATGDALTQFPDDPRQETWRWKLAYYMALAGEGYEATEIYADLIKDVLNHDAISPQDLPGWFRSGEMSPHYLTPLFTLEIKPITIPGIEAGFLLNIGELADIDTPGSSCVLLVENDGFYNTHIIHSGFPEDGFWIGLRNPGGCYAKDVTDDGIDEVIVDQWSGGHVGTRYVLIFDITTLPPIAMPFSPVQNDYLAVWNSSIRGFPIQDGKTQIQLGTVFSSCIESGLINYQWNGAWFEFSQGSIEFEETPYRDDDALSACVGNITQFASYLKNQQAFWVLNDAYTAYISNVHTNLQILEEFRILMGLSSAYQGDQDMASSIFHEIATSPTSAESIWIKPAQEFLEAYQSPSDLYRACAMLDICVPYYSVNTDQECVDVHLCDQQKVLEALITTVYYTYPLEQIPGSLRLAGLDINAEGLYDFDGDAREELWFNVLPPGETTYQFWIVAEYNRSIKPLIVLEGLLDEITEAVLIEGAPVDVSDDFDFTYKQTFALVRHPVTDEPYVAVRDVMEPSHMMQVLEQFLSLRRSLYAGNDPGPIYDQLLSIDKESVHCPFEEEDEDGTTNSIYDCSAFYYTLAFAAELAGMDKEAVEYYFNVINEYPERSLALLALEKLVQD